MSAPRAKGYSSSPKGIQSHLLPHAGALTERATRYFGLDLSRLPQNERPRLPRLIAIAPPPDDCRRMCPPMPSQPLPDVHALITSVRAIVPAQLKARRALIRPSPHLNNSSIITTVSLSSFPSILPFPFIPPILSTHFFIIN
jgi:hypothetical protein